MSVYYPNHKLYLSDILGKPLTHSNVNMRLSANWKVWQLFQTFPEEVRERIYQFLEGKQGIRLFHDAFFRRLFHPEAHAGRLEEFLSVVLQQKVTVEYALPSKENELSDAGSSLINGLIVRLSDGSIATVTMLPMEHEIAGEQGSCYLSDMILREYHLARTERGREFTYRDMKPVYLIVLLEKNNSEFQRVADTYIHHGQIVFDSGCAPDSMENIFYISLDTYRTISRDKDISTIQDAWMTFLSFDSPDKIFELVSRFPKFLSIYREIAEFRRHPDQLIFMFAEALHISDRPLRKNT